MSKDYSEYKKTEYDKYRIRRANSKNVKFDYFNNTVSFLPEERRFVIHVDDYNEYLFMQDMIDEVGQEKAERNGTEYHRLQNDEETEKEAFEDTQERFAAMKSKYDFNAGRCLGEHTYNDDKVENAVINVFSGSTVNVNYGEGILDFIYADFVTPLKEQLKSSALFETLREAYLKDKNIEEIPVEDKVEKIYNRDQEIVSDFEEYEITFFDIKDVAYASLYSAICPPVFSGTVFTSTQRLKRYGNYLLDLQKEYRELIEFCYDEDFYPEILGDKYPSERLSIYRAAHKLPSFFHRKEELEIRTNKMGGKEMPFGAPSSVIIDALKSLGRPLTEEEKEFGEKIGLTGTELVMHLRHPFFMSVKYDFSTIPEMLELELTKMLEQNVRFRKCKRCGKYFIMKGNYDTNYCDRVAEGETRNCQELAAQENYKAKIADDKAIPIYNKYYKRYAARLKVRQIKEADFKHWKYQAMRKRDECSAGEITPEEYIEWMEAAFPNRTPKK